jgi:histidinol-phosphate/aromatic aminotransferase/cobyric acid decarboxylase-like protein
VLLHFQISIGAASTFELNADILEATIMEQKAAGRTVKAFFLVNPNNPLGDVYSSQLVLQLMEVCHRSVLVLLDLLIPGTFGVLNAVRCGSC